MKNKYNFLVVAMAFVVGVMLALTISKIVDNRRWDRFAFLTEAYSSSWTKLNLIATEIERNYVDDVDVDSLTAIAATALLESLDPHSMYMPPEEKKSSDESLSSGFEGIGITFNVPEDTAVVISVIPGGPSSKVGLIPGDRLIKADTVDVAGVKMPQDEMIRHFKGPKGSKVQMTVRRGGEDMVFEITRDRIPMHSIDIAYMINDTTGYIRLSKFSQSSFLELREAGSRLKSSGMKQLLFDLRDNTGGYLDQAVLLSNEFLSKGDTIVYMEGTHRKRTVYKADGNGILQGIRLKVLVNEFSASSSEILAGAIQDNDCGLIIGRRTFGKGLVQESIPFLDGSGMRLTVARYYTPSGRCIQKPYDNYEEDYYNRLVSGELFSGDGMVVDSSLVYHTRSGRAVYGGGGIVPDVFVGMDTTRANAFHVAVNRKSAVLRYSSYAFTRDKERVLSISSFDEASSYIKSRNFEKDFVRYAVEVCGAPSPSVSEWKESRQWLMPQIYGLILRYSPLGEEAYYHYIMPNDETVQKALEQ